MLNTKILNKCDLRSLFWNIKFKQRNIIIILLCNKYLPQKKWLITVSDLKTIIIITELLNIRYSSYFTLRARIYTFIGYIYIQIEHYVLKKLRLGKTCTQVISMNEKQLQPLHLFWYTIFQIERDVKYLKRKSYEYWPPWSCLKLYQ